MPHAVICRRCSCDISREHDRLVITFSGGWTGDEFIASEEPLMAVLCHDCAEFVVNTHRFIYELLEPFRTDPGETNGC